MSSHPKAFSRNWLNINLGLLLVVDILHLAKAQYVDPGRSTAASRRNPRSSSGDVPFHDIEKRDDQSSSSRQIFVNSYDDFCLFGPPEPFSFIWSSGRNVVSWCSKGGHGTRLIPDGTVQGVTYVKTKDWIQVSGYGDFTKINIAPGDAGGQFDSSKNTPEGASVSTNNGDASSWVTLISADTFCLRACTGDPKYCPAEYDQMGCWFLTGDSVGPWGTYQSCSSDSGDPPGVIDGQTYQQGASPTPQPTAPELKDCQPGTSISNGQSAPPMHDWGGEGGGSTAQATPTDGGDANNPASASATAGADEGNSDDSAGSEGSIDGATDGIDLDSGGTRDGNDSTGEEEESDGTEGGVATTSWMPVSTCIPCSGDSDPSGAISTFGDESLTIDAGTETGDVTGTTEQVGITQASPTVAAVALTDVEGAGDLGSPTSSGLALGTPTGATTTSLTALKDDLLAKRQSEEQTITSDGQCCFTTWTPTIAGGATQTGLGGVSTATNLASATSSETGIKDASLGLGTGQSLSTASGLHSGSGSVLPTSSVSGSKSSNITTGSNSTNSTDSADNGTDSGGLLTIDTVNLDSLRGTMLSLAFAMGLAMLMGGWSLV